MHPPQPDGEMCIRDRLYHSERVRGVLLYLIHVHAVHLLGRQRNILRLQLAEQVALLTRFCGKLGQLHLAEQDKRRRDRHQKNAQMCIRDRR